MARCYSRRRGKSGSKKPAVKSVPSWVRYKSKEVELLVAKLAKEGKTGSQIGMFLRDAYGIPNVQVIAQKSVGQILTEKNLSKKLPEDLLALIKRAVQIRKHVEENHKDQPAVRGLALTEAKINRLVRYYKRAERLQADFTYRPENARFYLE
jgi:small subunit ribosomal protein S15